MKLLRSLQKKYYRWKLPTELAHMAKVSPHFRIEDNTVLWKNKAVAKLKPLSSLKQFAAEQCYIVATGPSITHVDLSKLKGERCFGVNGATALENITFDLYCVVDCDFIVNRFPLVKKALLSNAHCLFNYYNLQLICERDASLLANANISLIHRCNQQYNQPALNESEFANWLAVQKSMMLHPTVPHQQAEVGFSKEASVGCFGGGTVAFHALQLAYYIGFHRVYILGMDLGSSGSLPRFYESGKDIRPSHLSDQYESTIKPAFEIVHALCHEEAFKVYNLSAQSRLPNNIIPKVDYPWL